MGQPQGQMAGTHGGRAQGECLIAGILMVTGGCCCLKYLFAAKGTGGIGGGRNRQIGGGGGWGRGRGGGEEGEPWTPRRVREETVQQGQGAGLAASPAA